MEGPQKLTATDDSGTGNDGTFIDNDWLQDLYDSIRDWQKGTYTPSWTGTGSNPAIGNGTITGTYHQLGDEVAFRVVIVMGSTTTYGTGTYKLSLPVNAQIGGGNVDVSIQKISGGGGGAVYNGKGFIDAAGTVTLILTTEAAGAAAGGVTPTTPFTLANTDIIYVDGRYFKA